MSPRPGGSGGSYSGYYSSSNPWTEEVQFSIESFYDTKPMFITGFAFDVLTMVVLILGIVWACLIRNHRGAMGGVISSLVAWLIATVLIIIYEIFSLAEATLTQYYLIDLFMFDFFSMLSNCLVIFVFYNLIHDLLDRLTDQGKPYAVVATIHWVILGLVSALSIATWALNVAYQARIVEYTYSSSDTLGEISIKVFVARDIVFWVVALEILAWAIFVTVKAGSHRFASKLPAFSLIIGSVFWFAYSLMWTVIDIRYDLGHGSLQPRYLEMTESICQFFFCIGIYVGILLCCQNWRKLGNGEDKPAQVAQYPYGAAPAGYQAYQPYPQQDSQQPYPQYPQYVQQPQPQQVHGQPQQQ